MHFSLQEFYAMVAILTMTICFLIYLGIYQSAKLKQSLAAKHGPVEGNKRWVIIGKLSGFFFLGIVPIFVTLLVFQKPLSEFGCGPITKASTWYWMLGGSLLVILINVWQGRKPSQYAIYPLIRQKAWDRKTVWASLSTSTLFILGYEFMFRGFFLYACIPLMGVWVAVGINVLVYALAHIHKGMGETIGSVPFGILLCYITLSTGNIWAIAVIHVCLSLSADVVGFWANPEMKLSWKQQ